MTEEGGGRRVVGEWMREEVCYRRVDGGEMREDR